MDSKKIEITDLIRAVKYIEKNPRRNEEINIKINTGSVTLHNSDYAISIPIAGSGMQPSVTKDEKLPEIK